MRIEEEEEGKGDDEEVERAEYSVIRPTRRPILRFTDCPPGKCQSDHKPTSASPNTAAQPCAAGKGKGNGRGPRENNQTTFPWVELSRSSQASARKQGSAHARDLLLPPFLVLSFAQRPCSWQFTSLPLTAYNHSLADRTLAGD